MSRPKPAYFDAIREFAVGEWESLERASWRRAVHQLFREVQSPQHVISELLQNADDADARWVRITIDHDVFVLEHDGADFTEAQFKALCSFGVSSKSHLHTIGFRGIGFKSVFSYGPRVEVHTPTLAVAFEVERFTVPIWLDDAPEANNTFVIIPFASPETAERARVDLEMWAASPTPLLFFRNIEWLEFQGKEISKETLGPGPAPGSRRMRLHARESRTVLYIESEEEPFPSEVLDEIKQERDTAELNLHACRVSIVLDDPAGPRLYVVLPTSVQPKLTFSCNAPFLQDPGRKMVKDPLTSATNRWLLTRIGRLAVQAMQAWLSDTSLPLGERVAAYGLLSQPAEIDASLESAIARTVLQAFTEVFKAHPLLLTTAGTLAPAGTCLAPPPDLYRVWEPHDLLRVLGNGATQVLAREVPRRVVALLRQWRQVEPLSGEDALDRLAAVDTLPRPPDENLLALWAFVEPLARQWNRRSRARSYPIVPVEGDAQLHPAARVLVLGQSDRRLSEDDLAFMLRYLHVVDHAWAEQMGGHERHSSTENLEEDARVRAARDLFDLLDLNQPVSAVKVVERVAAELTDRGDPSDWIALARIAARVGVQVPATFRFLCRDGSWRSSTDGLLVEPDNQTASLLPETWAERRVLHANYERAMTPTERSQWREWALFKAGLWDFPPPIKHEWEGFGAAEMEQFCRQRGGKSPVLPARTPRFIYRDADFDRELWQHWHAWARYDPAIWSRVVRGLARQWDRLPHEASVLQKPSPILRPLEHGRLVACWLHRLRALPCLPDRFGQPAVPSELLRVTPHTAFLEDIERFVHLDFDKPELAKILDALGVRSDPTGFDIPLGRLRALAEAEHPPLAALCSLYTTLDRLVARLPADELAALCAAFEREPLVYTADSTWQTSGEVVQRNDADVPGVTVIHPEIAALGLTLWDRLGVAEQPSLEQVLDALMALPRGETLSSSQRHRVTEVLARYPARVWRTCRAWMDLAGRWKAADELRWWVTQAETAHGLFPHVRQRVADLTMLPPDVDPVKVFDGLAPLAPALSQRLLEIEPTGSPYQPAWLTTLADGLARVQPADRGGDGTDPVGHPDRETALRIGRSRLQPVKALRTEPCLGSVPVGQARSHRALWHEDTIYVVGSSATHHEELVRTLTAPFTDRSLQNAIITCIDRDPAWIAEYLEANLSLGPPLPHGAGISVTRPPQATPTISGVFRDALLDATTLDGMEDEAAAEDEDDEPPEGEGRSHVKPIQRQRAGRRAVLLAFLRKLGYQLESRDTLRGPDGTVVRLNISPLHGIAYGPGGDIVARYWVGDRSLLQGVEIGADVWSILTDDPASSWVVLPAGGDSVRAYLVEQLATEAEVFAARYRLTARVQPWRGIAVEP